tara:strand:+ start:156 stop:761 length:606 start_codon:yes stop_codon:yes gene_type:complete
MIELLIGAFLLLLVWLAIAKTYRKDSEPPKFTEPRPSQRIHQGFKPKKRALEPTGYYTGDHLTRTNGVDHAPPPPFPVSMIVEGPAYVIDGDTIRIGNTKIRLAGIDAPELDRPWGQKSKWAMVRICKGHIIRAELTGDTSYDRLVGTCFLPDGTDIGAEIIKVGLALDGGFYSEGKYRHLEPAGVRRKIKPLGNQAGPRS